jgi:hypothetical protein
MFVFVTVLALSHFGSQPRQNVRLLGPLKGITRGLHSKVGEVSNCLSLNVGRNAFREQRCADSTTMFGGTP